MSSLKFTRGQYFLDYDYYGKVVCVITRVENYRIYYRDLNRKNYKLDRWFHPKGAKVEHIKMLSKDDAMVELL